MTPEYCLRLARLDELTRLQEIERLACTRFAPFGLAETFLRVAMPLETLRRATAAGRVWVAVDAGNRPVGFAVATRLDGHAHLDELDVHPDHGRCGIGTALVEAVCDWARSTGSTAITLTTLDYVPWNAPWYQRLGFEVVPDAACSAAERTLLEDEVRVGLPADGRVLMKRAL